MVVIDAGIADEGNPSFLRDEGYDYIYVARNKPIDVSKIEEDDLLTIKKDRNNKVEVKLIKEEGENILYCNPTLTVNPQNQGFLIYNKLILLNIDLEFSKIL